MQSLSSKPPIAHDDAPASAPCAWCGQEVAASLLFIRLHHNQQGHFCPSCAKAFSGQGRKHSTSLVLLGTTTRAGRTSPRRQAPKPSVWLCPLR